MSNKQIENQAHNASKIHQIFKGYLQQHTDICSLKNTQTCEYSYVQIGVKILLYELTSDKGK